MAFVFFLSASVVSFYLFTFTTHSLPILSIYTKFVSDKITSLSDCTMISEKICFVVVQVLVSIFLPPLPSSPVPPFHPWSYPPLTLFVCPLYMFLDDPSLFFPFILLLPPLWSLSVCSLFQCLWLYFACLFFCWLGSTYRWPNSIRAASLIVCCSPKCKCVKGSDWDLFQVDKTCSGGLFQTISSFLRKLKMELPFDPAIPLLGLYPKSPETPIQKNLCTPMFIAAQFTIAKCWKQPKCAPVNEWIKNLWYIYAMEYYAAERKRELLPFTKFIY